MKHELAGSAAGFNAFSQALKGNALVFKVANDANQIRKAAWECQIFCGRGDLTLVNPWPQ